MQEVAGIENPQLAVIALLDIARFPVEIAEDMAFEPGADAVGVGHLLVIAGAEIVGRQVGVDALRRRPRPAALAPVMFGAGRPAQPCQGIGVAREAGRHEEAAKNLGTRDRIGRRDLVAQQRFGTQALLGIAAGKEAAGDEGHVRRDVVMRVPGRLGAADAAGQGGIRHHGGAAGIQLHAALRRQIGQAGNAAKRRIVDSVVSVPFHTVMRNSRSCRIFSWLRKVEPPSTPACPIWGSIDQSRSFISTGL